HRHQVMGGLMSEATISLPQFGPRETILLWIVLFSSVIALGYGLYLRRLVLRRDPGPDSMVRVATAIQEGAMAYLRRQLRTMLPFIAVVTAGLYLLYAPIYAQHRSEEHTSELQSRVDLVCRLLLDKKQNQ